MCGGRLFTVGCVLYQWVHFEVNISFSSMSFHLDLNSSGGMGLAWALSLPQWGADILHLWRSRAVNPRGNNHSARVQCPCHARKLAFYVPLPDFLTTYIPAAASCVMFSKLCGKVWSVEMFSKGWMDKENIVIHTMKYYGNRDSTFVSRLLRTNTETILIRILHGWWLGMFLAISYI